MELHTFPIERALKASLQQRELYEGKGLAGEAYRASCHALWALLDKGARPHSLKGTPFEYLARKFNNLREESKLKPGRLDPVFRDWLTFAYHVGPRPSDKHQLDRINDSDNYRVGNVRWLHATRQNSNKRANRHHLYRGRRFTDAELSALLAKNFKNYSPEAIKKYRQRMAKAGYSNDEITREIFKRHGLSYESSGNPLEDADFSPKYYKKLSQAYRVSGGGLTRIAFEIAWLQEQIKKLEKDQSEIFNLTVEGLGEVESSLLHRLGELHWDLRDAREREAKLTLLKVKQDIENTDPETACGALIKDMLSQGITTFEKNKLAAAL
ncbi:hypothetical protein [Diaphorobacter nitroreducens]|uniref:hypothetical protein n=1 Tax=Diaphorobacter nitroreducens TaxID=164759 RepID=UPI0028AA2250|nr:hypothetical protein [Diaphorobacter nitroreducens]